MSVKNNTQKEEKPEKNHHEKRQNHHQQDSRDSPTIPDSKCKVQDNAGKILDCHKRTFTLLADFDAHKFRIPKKFKINFFSATEFIV